jgi:hypothetical protein
MSHFTDVVVEPALGFLADWSLRWAVLIGGLAVWLVVRRPRRVARRYLVCWAVLLAGLLLPGLPRWGPGFGSARTFTTSSADRTPAPAAPAEPARKDPLPVHPEPPLPTPVQAEPAAVAFPAPSAPPPLISPNPVEVPLAEMIPETTEPLGAWRMGVLGLAGFWAVGVTICLTRWVFGWWLLQRLRRSALPVAGASGRLFGACRADLGLNRPVVLAVQACVRSPVTLGLFHPMVLVPPSWTDLPEADQRGSLLHELAHLVRYDDWLALLLESVRAVFFFHPLVHCCWPGWNATGNCSATKPPSAKALTRASTSRCCWRFRATPAAWRWSVPHIRSGSASAGP